MPRRSARFSAVEMDAMPGGPGVFPTVRSGAGLQGTTGTRSTLGLRHWVLAGLLTLGFAAGCTSAPAPTGPVVALITIDTWRLDHFSATHTPNLWALAAQGERFTNAWTPIGLTTPAHVSMWTGLAPWEHGVEGNNHHGYVLDGGVPYYPERPAHAAWAKGAFVSAYPAGPEGGLARGWTVFEGPQSGERPGDVAVAQALAWLPTDQPALLWVHVYEPHGPYVGDGPDDVARYAEEVSRADALLKPLLDELTKRGARIVVAADHGEVLLEERCGRQHERSVSDSVLRVPLFRWAPGLTPRVVTDRVGLMDVPTLLDGADPAPRAHWLAESGICEAGCSPGCAPTGLLGRDRIGVSDAGRWVLRGGRFHAQGEPSPALAEAVKAMPAVTLPGAANAREAALLGYTSEPAP